MYEIPKDPTHLEMVREFMDVYSQEVRTIPPLQGTNFPVLMPEYWMRLDLINEEYSELEHSMINQDIVEIADALGDLLYVIYGTALSFGIPIDAVMAEIHRSNLSKLDEDGTVIRRADGKVLKGPAYSPPNINMVLYKASKGLPL